MMMQPTLPDLLEPNLDVVFCGTAASAGSARRGMYYAGPGNRFWQTLQEVGLTKEQLDPAEYQRLLEYRIGLTDIAKGASGADVDIPGHAYDAESLTHKMLEFRPRALAFNGKNAGKRFFGRRVDYGRQQGIGETAVFVLPSTSGAARRYWDVGPWEDLAAYVQSTRRKTPKE